LKIVWLIADGLRRDHVACYGNRWLETTHINRIADRSLRFDGARVERPECCSVRLEWLTGIRSSRLNDPLLAGHNLTRATTLPGLLRAQGFFTGLISDNPRTRKVYDLCGDFDFVLHVTGQADDPHVSSFDSLEPGSGSGASSELLLPQEFAPPPDQIERYFRNRRRWSTTGHPTQALFERAGECLEKLANVDNWFLLIDSFAMLPPWDAPREFAQFRSQPKADKLAWPRTGTVPTATFGEDQIKSLRCAYADSCLFFDRAMQSLVDRLESREDIHLFLMSDHGTLIGDHGAVGFDANSPLPAAADQVLLVVRPDGKTGSSDQIISPADVFASTCTLGSIDPGKWTGGEIIEEVAG
jgi:arylsulfatase A-like enzyme